MIPSDLSASPVASIHRDLLDRLTLLDRLGEHVAAAHLAAAIDALEEQLHEATPGLARDRKDDPIEAMAHGLVARFGERAVEAARRQLHGASGQVLLVWAAIVSRVETLLARQSADATIMTTRRRG